MTWQQTIDEEKDIAFEEGIERGEEKKPWSLRKIFSEKETLS